MKIPKYIVFEVNVHGTSVELKNITDDVEDVILKSQADFCEFKGSMCETCEMQTECPWK